MKIAIDANEAFRQELTGIGIYARNLVTYLSRLSNDERIMYLAIRSSSSKTSFLHEHQLKLLTSFTYRSLWSQLRLPLHLLANNYEVFHSLDHKLPPLCPCKSVVTIYDLAFFKFEATVRKVHYRRFAWFTRDAIQRATHLIAISNSTKDDICSIFNVIPEKIDVVHLGVDQSLFHKNVVPQRKQTKYILSVGTLQPRKNYVMLIRAFKRFCAEWGEPIKLYIVGKRGWLWEDIEAEAMNSPFADRIEFLGFVPEEQMPSLYAGAELFVMPSLYEGFGIPPLEAMACGTPVLAANTSSLPEVIGNAGILLDPRDEILWSKTICDVLNDIPLREQLQRQGYEQVKKFTWEQTAAKTLGIYKKLAG